MINRQPIFSVLSRGYSLISGFKENNFLYGNPLYNFKSPPFKEHQPNRNFHNKKSIAHSSVIIQDGTSIIELPCIIQIINEEFEFENQSTNSENENKQAKGILLKFNPKEEQVIDLFEESLLVSFFDSCQSIPDLYSRLNDTSLEEITPSVSLAIMKRLFYLENNVQYRNQDLDLYPQESDSNFTRISLLKHMVELICSSDDPELVVDALRVISRDSYRQEILQYFEQLCVEAAILAANAKLQVQQACDVMKYLYYLGDLGKNYIDKIWPALTERQDEINAENLCTIISILPLVKNSRRYLINIVERRIPIIWGELKPEQVIKIFHIIVELKMSNSRMVVVLSNWFNLNLHLLTEGNFRWIIYSFLSLKYVNASIQNAINRFLKVKAHKINDPAIITTVTDYLSQLLVRDKAILELAASYFYVKHEKFSTTQTLSLISCFGNLNFTPENIPRFFEVFDLHLRENYIKFPPEAIIDICLSCAFLKHYPMYLIPGIYHRLFFLRLHSLNNTELDKYLKKIQILDFSLALEVPNHKSSLLFEKDSSVIYGDMRAMASLNKIKSILEKDIVSQKGLVTYCVLPEDLPYDSHYVIDCVLNFNSNSMEKDNMYFGLIHPSQHYDSSEEVLIGPQAMKIRHLKKLGFKVFNLKCESIDKLSAYEHTLRKYIEDAIKNAESEDF